MMKCKNYIMIFVAAVLALGMTGCGVSHKSPEGVTESLIKAYVKGKEKSVRDCYGQKKTQKTVFRRKLMRRLIISMRTM